MASSSAADLPEDDVHDPERLAALQATGLLDSVPEAAFDRFTRLAVRLLDVDASLISLVGAERQFYKSKHGFSSSSGTPEREDPLSHSYCKYVVEARAPVVVEDAREDERLAGNPAIKENDAVAYLGIPLETDDGHVLGSLCAIHAKPRAWSDEDVELLGELADAVMARVELRREKKRAEHHRRERDRFFELSLDLFATAGLDGYFKELNPAWEEMLGYTREEMKARPYLDFVHPDDHEVTLQAAERMKTETLVGFQNRYRDKEGRYHWLDWNAAPAPDEEQVYCVARDLTGRRARERERERLAHIAENASDLIGAVTLEGEPLFLNKAGREIVGLTEEAFQASHMTDFLMPAERERLTEEIIPEVLDGSGRWRGEVQLRHFQTGEPILMDYNIFTTPDPATGEPAALVTISRDMRERKARETELHRAKEAAEEASAAKSRFVANVSHELRTPLNAVIGYSDMFRQDPRDFDPEQLRQGLERIHDSGHQLLNLINDVLDLTKAQSGQMRVRLEDFDLAGFIAAVTEEMRPQVQENDNSFEVEGLDAVGQVCTDRAKLRQILYNLLSNAGKYTTDGDITLAVEVREDENAPPLPETADDDDDDVSRRDSDEARRTPESGLNRELVLHVTDTGIGLTAEEQETIFEAFERTERAETVRGTGLGLQIVQNLCELLGGRVEVESAKDEGSTFSVRLPVGPTPPGKAEDGDERTQQAQREAAASAAAAAEREIANQLPPQRDGLVLVIDDDRDARMLMRNYLREEGFEVETASTGNEGIEQAFELHPMAITLDVLMDGMDGWEVLTRLKREDSPLRHVPVIMVTITPSERHAFRLGASDHIVKPVTKERLTEMLAAYRREDPPPSVSVLVIDDDEAVRDRVRGVLEGHAENHSVHEAQSEDEVLRLLDEEHFVPDLVLLDLILPETDPFLLLKSLHERAPEAAVIALTDEDLSAEIVQRLNEQVEQIIQKRTYTREDLLTAVRRRMNQLHRSGPSR